LPPASYAVHAADGALPDKQDRHSIDKAKEDILAGRYLVKSVLVVRYVPWGGRQLETGRRGA
jgi:hypothetical protein